MNEHQTFCSSTRVLGISVDCCPKTLLYKNTWTSHSRELLIVVPELEVLVFGVLVAGPAAATEQQTLREEHLGAPPAGGQKK